MEQKVLWLMHLSLKKISQLRSHLLFLSTCTLAFKSGLLECTGLSRRQETAQQQSCHTPACPSLQSVTSSG